MNTPLSNEKNIKTRNLIIRICSLVCAIILWIYVSDVESPTSEKTFSNITVTVENAGILQKEYGLALITPSTSASYTTDVTLRGKKSVLNKIKSSEIDAYFDLSKIDEAGKKSLDIQIEAPDGTTVVSSSLTNLNVVIDKREPRVFEITPDITYGQYNSAYELGECIITDSSSKQITHVTVTGPQKELDTISEIRASAHFDEIDASVEAKVNLVMYDIQGEEITSSNLKLDISSVTIKLPLYETKILKLKVEQVHNTFSQNQISFQISPSTISVKGDPKILSGIDSIFLDPIDETTIIDGKKRITLGINLPNGVELLSGEKNTAEVLVTLFANKDTISVPTTDIVIENPQNSLSYEFEESSVTIEAYNSISSSLNREDVILTVNAASYTEPGTYTVNVSAAAIDRIDYAFVIQKTYTATLKVTKK